MIHPHYTLDVISTERFCCNIHLIKILSDECHNKIGSSSPRALHASRSLGIIQNEEGKTSFAYYTTSHLVVFDTLLTDHGLSRAGWPEQQHALRRRAYAL